MTKEFARQIALILIEEARRRRAAKNKAKAGK